MKKIVIFVCVLTLFLIVIYPTSVKALSIDEIFTGADNFLDIGGGQDGVNATIDDTALGDTSDLLYNILLGISMIMAVIIGMVLGIKYMMATSEEKADIKQTLPAYIVSCIVVFGAFSIWKLVINIIQ